MSVSPTVNDNGGFVWEAVNSRKKQSKLNTCICFAFFFPSQNRESFIAPAIEANYNVCHVPLAMFT